MDDINGYRYVLYVLRALLAFVKLCCAYAVLFLKRKSKEYDTSIQTRLENDPFEGFTGGFWKQNLCLVVVFLGFERLVVNQNTRKHPVWYQTVVSYEKHN